MFRELVRKNQALSKETFIEILKRTKRGVLSIYGEEGYPYGMPMNHYYNEQDGKLYFHSGKFGHKMDALKKNPNVSFCIYEEGEPTKEGWALQFQSVIIFGTIEWIESYEETMEIARQLCYKFTDDEVYIEKEILNSGPATVCFALKISHMTGKHVNES